MGTKMLSMLCGLLLVGCFVPGRAVVYGTNDPCWDGYAYVTIVGHTHSSHCGHYYYDGCWNVYTIEHVYSQPGYGRRGHVENVSVSSTGGGTGHGNVVADSSGNAGGKGNGNAGGNGNGSTGGNAGGNGGGNSSAGGNGNTGDKGKAKPKAKPKGKPKDKGNGNGNGN